MKNSTLHSFWSCSTAWLLLFTTNFLSERGRSFGERLSHVVSSSASRYSWTTCVSR
ncbi:hypothetical protein PF002_g3141 [Phytophthora fragariae]|uniref:RxLR effector protein n=1 Tax=Phytophthora fragariae TaxID=53985 RepID=A0A6A4A7Z7_9STRA|nr:hypothetical protein PF003_g21971 [Phytophthora fragariae]KAE9253912.1 hypothetical protein PF002_g3141 [Phytophthora fragariae]KAE9307667.1 hypothetical protein PF001_g11519 [Phytophthora fragariae]KAE9339818.1 hypothetical protein PF008_g11404 [Phytophthora fragariae]